MGQIASIDGKGARTPGGDPQSGASGDSGASAPPLKSNSIHLTYREESTEFTRINGRQYIDGMKEATWGRPRKRNPDLISTRGMSMNAERNRENVIKRAKTAIRRKTMHNLLDYMITATTRTCITDRDIFGAMVSELQRQIKLRIPEWDAITILEKQERGAWHAHLAVRGWQKLDLIRKIWKNICDEGGGAIHVRPPKGTNKGKHLQWDMVKLAGYLCKYITKAVGEDHIFDKKTYWHTRGIDNPPVVTILVQAGSESYWAGYLVDFIPGRKRHTWEDYNGAIGRVANF